MHVISTSSKVNNSEHLIEVKGLVKYFPVLSRGIIRTKRIGWVHAVDNVSFHIDEGETLGLVGESGCGKTTLARTILYLIPPTSGTVYFDGENVFEVFKSGDKSKIMELRRKMQILFQNPYTFLDPRMTVKEILSEPFEVHGVLDKEKITDAVFKLLDMVGLEPYHADRYPHEFSGGQRRRISIARALALEPKFLILDEPVASLDMSIRSQILKLLIKLQQEKKLTYLCISHDLNSILHVSDRVAVMYLGKFVEIADVETIFKKPAHPYTKALISAVPVIDPKTGRERIILQGEVPSAINPPKGCRFHPRCPHTKDICKKREPQLVEIEKGHLCACHLVSG